MADDLVPANDADFNLFEQQFIKAVAANPATYGLTAQDVTGLQTAQGKWDTAYPAHVQAQTAAVTATHTKNEAREDLEALLRAAARKVNGHPEVDNALRASAGLPPRDTTRTPVGVPATRPMGRVELKPNHTMVIHFLDETTPNRTAKPQGVHGCQIWAYVGDTAPADPKGYAFLALDTRTPYTDEHAAADAGKNAYYLLRWQNGKGEAGPWSDVVTAKIPL